MEHLENRLGAFLVNKFGDRYLHAVNRNAFNATGSDALYNSYYGGKLFLEFQFNLVIGTDSGILPRYLVKNGIPEGSRYLFVELPEVLARLKSEGILEGLPEEIVVVSQEEWLERAYAVQFQNYVFLNAVVLHGSLASSDAHLTEYRELSWNLNLELESILYHLLTSTNCSQFVLRQIENLSENRLGFAQTLLGAFAGRTAVILAGGPSLQAALPWVRENRDRVVIIAVSRISRILIDQGIVPHIIATVDPQQISFEVSRELLNFAPGPDQPLLVQSNHSTSLLVGQWHGKCVYTATLFPWRTPINNDNLFYTGPTVGNYALSVAMHLGCSDIVLAGVDLCFSPKGQTHAEGSNENKVGPDLGQFSSRLETYGGWHADTTQGYAEALRVLATQAELARRHGHRLYNCSPGAAKVEMIDFIELEALSLPAAEDTPSEVIARRVPEPTGQSRLSHYRLVHRELSRARLKFRQILTLSREALGCADGLFGTNGRKRDFRYKVRMDKIERRLDSSFGEFTLLMKQFGIKKFLTIAKAPEQAESWSDAQIEQATRDYYETYVEGAEFFIDLMDGALQRVESRMEEEKGKPAFDKLFTQWENDRQCGRLRIWLHNHPEGLSLMSPEERNRADAIAREFERTLTEERTSQIELLEKLHDVKHIRSKALLLFARKELAELQTIAEGLAGHPNQEKALPYRHFVNGLIAELHDDPEEAVSCYQNLLDESSPLAEDALLQLATLALSCQDADSALLAMDCLVGMSPAYLPPYADLLLAVGRFEDAFNAYNNYVGLVPEDVNAMMKLGVLCTEAGLADAARDLFRRVLARDANNAAAQKVLADLDAADLPALDR